MSIVRRMAVIIRSLLQSTTERVDRITAEEELRVSKAKQAADELDAAVSHTEHLESTARSESVDRSKFAIPDISPRVSDPLLSKLSADYKLLGIRPGADLQAVENAWRELARRADPKRFPSGSEEEKRAAEILKSLNEAYARIREAINPTEGRFGRLEL